MNTAAAQPRPSFNLLHRFAVASLLVIAAIAIGNAILLTNFVTKHLLDREAHVTMEFLMNVLQADGSIGYLADPAHPELAARFEGSLQQLTAMPDVQRINVYSREHTVLWSTDRALIGRKFDQNEELDEALRGELAIEGGSITDAQRQKPEHVGLPAESAFFVETYIPIRSAGKPEVLGVFELYKAPVALTAAIRDGHRQIWLTAFLGAVALYLTLFWIVRSADRKIKEQHQRLLKAETMAAVGELAASVAHNIRNPLASIRSSAELALETPDSSTGEQARDIMAGVDRIEEWLRDLVSFALVDASPAGPVDAAQLMQHCFRKFAQEFERSGIQAEVSTGPHLASVRADRALLGHVLHLLVANAIEATDQGGRITGEVTQAPGKVKLRIADTGRGIAPEHLAKLFTLFFTTKPRGLGIGLTLAQRAIERFGGSIQVDSTPGVGTAFTIELPAAA
jgi:two-component system, NtrC family, sensor histidine kinase HydH